MTSSTIPDPAPGRRADRHDLALVRYAVEWLPVTCRYHGSNLTLEERGVPLLGTRPGSPCCDTGAPSLARRKAVAALDRLREDTP